MQTEQVDKLVLIERKGAILRLQLNRPQKKNALTVPMYEALIEALKTANSDPNKLSLPSCSIINKRLETRD